MAAGEAGFRPLPAGEVTEADGARAQQHLIGLARHHDAKALRAWARGGGTSVAQGRLLCPHHHHLAHDDRYDMRRLPNGKVRVTRRT